MTCDHVRAELAGKRLGLLTAEEGVAVAAHLDTCASCRAAWEADRRLAQALESLPSPPPSGKMRDRFHRMLELEMEQTQPVRRRQGESGWERTLQFFSWGVPRLGGAVGLIALGFLIGQRAEERKAETVLATERVAMGELQRKVAEMDRLVTSSLGQENSSARRLKQMLAAFNRPEPERWVLVDVVGVLAFEPSSNVRLEAVEALTPYVKDRVVTDGVRLALRRESAPLVQLAMIDLLAGTPDEASLPVLRQLVDDRSADDAVREAARRAVSLISSAPIPDGRNAPPAERTRLRL